VTNSFSEDPTSIGQSSPGSGNGTTLPEGTVIGRYRILRLVGEGGMGAVYEAEQEQPRRTVALKVIKPGLGSADLLRRFEREAQALGRLQHVGIAQIYEAGTATAGAGLQPYFAMEYIHGQSLREYVREHDLPPRDRLTLVAKVCEAVHHAHERGLVHRDLKPGHHTRGREQTRDRVVPGPQSHDCRAGTGR
jgi:serine/threonine protein kinase